MIGIFLIVRNIVNKNKMNTNKLERTPTGIPLPSKSKTGYSQMSILLPIYTPENDV